MLPLIAPVASCLLDIARSESCIAARAEDLLDPVLDAYTRALCHWSSANYRWDPEHHAAFAAAVLRWAGSRGSNIVSDLAGQLRDTPAALGALMRAFAIVGTYETQFVPVLADLWPGLMQLGIDAYDAHPPEAYECTPLLQNMIPAPSPSAYADDIDAVLERAQAAWFPLDAVSGWIDQWLRRAIDSEWCVDSLVGFLRAQPIASQANPGLDWVKALVVADDGSARTSGIRLLRWLRDLRRSGVLDARSRPVYHSVVDALALSGNSEARDLQRMDE